MKRFVNYHKRSIDLPKGCKNLSDLLKPPKQSQDSEEALPEWIRESQPQKCEYCGAPAVGGYACGSWRADGTKNEESHFWCEQRGDDLSEFRSLPENQLPQLSGDFDFDDPTATEALERLIAEIRKREEAFMLQRLAKRKGPDHAA